jgi:anti-sigma regulatory factor (Ser/Thr protein kinase)
MSGSGTRRERHALDGSAGSIAEAREHARLFLAECVPALSATQSRDALLAVSELATNAVRHAPGPYELTLGDDGAAVTIAVTDSHRETPAARPRDLDGGGGLGIHVLTALAGRVETTVGQSGKTVKVTLHRAGRNART